MPSSLHIQWQCAGTPEPSMTYCTASQSSIAVQRLETIASQPFSVDNAQYPAGSIDVVRAGYSAKLGHVQPALLILAKSGQTLQLRCNRCPFLALPLPIPGVTDPDPAGAVVTVNLVSLQTDRQ